MLKAVPILKAEHAFLNGRYCHSRFSRALAQRLSVFILLLAGALMTTSCGTAAQAANAQNGGGGGNVKVSVSPTSATLFSNQKQQFTATVSGTSNTGVTWSATAGLVNANGLYTAPTVTSQTNVVVTATSNADATKSASAAVTVDPQIARR